MEKLILEDGTDSPLVPTYLQGQPQPKLYLSPISSKWKSSSVRSVISKRYTQCPSFRVLQSRHSFLEHDLGILVRAASYPRYIKALLNAKAEKDQQGFSKATTNELNPNLEIIMDLKYLKTFEISANNGRCHHLILLSLCQCYLFTRPIFVLIHTLSRLLDAYYLITCSPCCTQKVRHERPVSR